MKTIHKTLFLVLTGLLIIPHMVFAAWWNPFNWNIYKVMPDETQSASLQQIEKPNVIEKSVTNERVEKPATVDLSDIYKRLNAIEERLLALESRPPSVIMRETVPIYDDLTDEVSDLEDAIESLASRFDDHQSCMRRWSIGNEFMLGDDVYHCSNK